MAVDAHRAGGHVRGSHDEPVADSQVADRVHAARRVDDPRADDGQRGGGIGQPAERAGRGHGIASQTRASTAMRTGTPFST